MQDIEIHKIDYLIDKIINNIEVIYTRYGNNLKINLSNEENPYKTEYTLLFFCSDGEGTDNDVRIFINKINGNLHSILDEPLIVAEYYIKAISPLEKYEDGRTESVYTFATKYAKVEIIWVGTSNGYYDEAISFELIEKENKK